MRILFIHQGFPGQFKHLAPVLAADPNNEVVAFSWRKELTPVQGVRQIQVHAERSTSANIHPYASDIETKAIRGEVVMRASLALRESGFTPDVIIAHPGWGESLFLKHIWPQAKLGIYCEFFYHLHGADVGFDPEFGEPSLDDACRLQFKNINNLLHFEIADSGISPTHWQTSTFPQPFRDKIAVIHDGIDCQTIRPRPDAWLAMNGQTRLTRSDEIITFVNRNLEPVRGYHQFMRALPELLRRRPNARVMIVGGNDVSYGARPPQGTTWRDHFLEEVKPLMTEEQLKRIHFLGGLPYAQFITLLQISTVHVYLTYPFVLSWSLLEAMSIGCAIVASDTSPVREAIRDGETGLLVDFFDHGALTDKISHLLGDPAMRASLGQAAREHAMRNYDLSTVCLPRQLEWVNALARGGR